MVASPQAAELADLRRRVAELEAERARAAVPGHGESADKRLEAARAVTRDRFENSPIPMTDEDWSGAKLIVDSLRADGVTDIRAHVRAHPEILGRLAPAVKILDANPAAVKIYNAASREELLAAFNAPPDLTTYNPTTGLSDIFVTLLHRFSAGETRVELEGPDTALDGSLLYIRTTTSIGRAHESDWSSVLQTVEDFSARRQAETELAAHRDHLEEMVAERTRELEAAQLQLVRTTRLATIGKLTGTVSHELRNPLATIRTSFHTLKPLIDASDPRVSRGLDRIERSIGRCVAIVEQLLSHARATPPALEDTAVDPWLADLLADLSISEEVELDLELGSGASAAVDRHRLAQALTNLIENACQAMLEDASDSARPRLVVRSARSADRVEISVADGGPGMCADVAEQMFEPLFSTRSSGFGLGLALVKEIAEQHAAEIAVDTAPGRGTRIALRLPLRGAAQ